MKRLEPFWYEVSPYVFSAIGIGAVAGGNRAGVAFGVLLLIAASLIIKMRWSYRAAACSGRMQTVRRAPRRFQNPGNSRKRYRSAIADASPARVRP